METTVPAELGTEAAAYPDPADAPIRTEDRVTRDVLKHRNGMRGRYKARVVRFGTKRAYRGPPLKTLLLVDVRDGSGTIVADHLWLTVGKMIERLHLEPGDDVTFEARVTPYVKGYRGDRDDPELPSPSIDYRLSNPTRLAKRAKSPVGQPTLITFGKG